MGSVEGLFMSTGKALTLLVRWLYAHTAGSATRRASAVVTNASAIPHAPADRPVALLCSMPLQAFKMPTTVPNRPRRITTTVRARALTWDHIERRSQPDAPGFPVWKRNRIA